MVILHVLHVNQDNIKTSRGILLVLHVLQGPQMPTKQVTKRRQNHAPHAWMASTRWTALLLARSAEQTFISPPAPGKTAAQPASLVPITLNQMQGASERHLANARRGIRAGTERRAKRVLLDFTTQFILSMNANRVRQDSSKICQQPWVKVLVFHVRKTHSVQRIAHPASHVLETPLRLQKARAHHPALAT